MSFRWRAAVWSGVLSFGSVILYLLRKMDDVVHSFASRFGLTEDEDCEVVVRFDSQVRVADFLMVGKLLAHKNYNKKAFMTFLRNLWSPKSCVSIRSLSGDRFLFFFQSEEDRNFVLNGGPWSFKKDVVTVGCG